MELKATEKEVSSLHALYATIYSACSKELPDITLPKPPELQEVVDASAAATNATGDSSPLPSTAQAIQEHWDDWLRRIESLASTIEKFRQRLSYIDPVTEQPRYGTQTAARVTRVVADYTTLAAMREPVEHKITAQLQTAVETEQQQAQAAAQTQQAEEAAAAQAAAAAAAAAQQAQHAARTAAAAQEQHAARLLAQQLTEERRAAAAADQAWIATCLPRSLDSVRRHLERFRAATERSSSLASLETLYAQILAHPEDETLRRIRRNHPQFLQDIGQYEGGREILIASGFDLGMVDEIPSYICREPNVETDLDGWTTWFDLLKGTLDLIREAQNNA